MADDKKDKKKAPPAPAGMAGPIIIVLIVLALLSRTRLGKFLTLSGLGNASSTGSYATSGTKVTAADSGKTLRLTHGSQLVLDLSESEYPYKNLSFVTRQASLGRVPGSGAWPYTGVALLSSDLEQGEADVIVRAADPSKPDFKLTLIVTKK